CGVGFEFALRSRVLLWRCLKIRVLWWRVLIDSSLVWWTVLIEIIALKTILVVVLLSRLMKSRWTHLSRNILTVLNEISDCCGLKLLDVVMEYWKIISSSSAVGVMKEFFISLRDFSNRFMVYQAYPLGMQLSAEDQKSLSEKKKEEEHLRLLSQHVSSNFGFDYAFVFPTRMTRNCISRRKIGTPDSLDLSKEVILNGNSAVQMRKDKAGNEVDIPPITAHQILARTRERKAKSTLLMAIPDDHLARFHGIKDAKTLWVAIKTRFDGNDESKKMQKNKAPAALMKLMLLIVFLLLQAKFLRHKVAMLSMRVKRFYKKTRRKLKFNATEPVGFDKTKVECFNCHRRGHYDRDCKTARNSGNRSRDAGNAGYKGRDNGKRHARVDDEKALVVQDGLGTYDWSYQVEEEATYFAVMAFTSNPSSPSSLNSKRKNVRKANLEIIGYQYGLESIEGQLLVHQQNEVIYKEKIGVLEYDVKDKKKELIETVFDNRSSDKKNSLANDRKTKEVRTSAPLIQDWDTDSDNDSVFRPTIFLLRSFYNATTHSRRNSTGRVNTARSKAVSVVKGNEVTAVKTSAGNKAYLADYQEINDGGFVAFGSSRGKLIVNTACYVLNRALVTKSHNKTPYELLNGRTPRLDFLQPFSCRVTILNTLDPLGKFEGKADEGFFVGYSVTSKAFRVFNTKTQKVEENLHVSSMNYIPVSAGNQTDKNAGPQDTNGNASTQDNVDAGKEASDQHYIMFPLWSSIFSTFKSSDDKAANDKPKDDMGLKNVEELINKED
nr:ribonuclease H-like domain-containing protein [Tanacetum cinerariifolium]